MTKDKYAQKFIDAIKTCKGDEELENVINKIYENGFEDGANSEIEETLKKKKAIIEVAQGIPKKLLINKQEVSFIVKDFYY